MRRSPFHALTGLLRSRLAQMVIGGNLTALLVMLAGFFVLGELRQELVQAKIDSLRASGEIMANALKQTATGETAVSELDVGTAQAVVRVLPEGPFMERTRIRVFDETGRAVVDSDILKSGVRLEELPPAEAGLNPFQRAVDVEALGEGDLSRTLAGESVSGERRRGSERVVIATFPIKRVSSVVGALVLETGGVDEVVWAERRALVPFVLVAMAVLVVWSLILTLTIVRPIRQLSIAARQVRRVGPRRADIPEVGHTRDEIGSLSRALRSMTRDLAQRIDSIENFAADVAHEIKNPLASIRSCLDTLPIARTDEQRRTLLAVLQHDVARIDRLVTDISAASRIDAEVGAMERVPVDIVGMLRDICRHYETTGTPNNVRFCLEAAREEILVPAAPEKLGQVFRNLLDNAITFSPPEGVVDIVMSMSGDQAEIRIRDQGPGIPPDALERVFERFYTERPAGAAFGSHSGLGLAISRQIVDAHGGSISAANRSMDNGAIFTVRLPVLG